MTTTLYVKDRVGSSTNQVNFFTRTGSMSAANDVFASSIEIESAKPLNSITVKGYVETRGTSETTLALTTTLESPLSRSLDTMLAGAYDGSTSYDELPAGLVEDDYIIIFHIPGTDCTIPVTDSETQVGIVRIGDEYITYKESGNVGSGGGPNAPINQPHAKAWLKIYKRGCNEYGYNVDDSGATPPSGGAYSQIRNHPTLAEVLNYGIEDTAVPHASNKIFAWIDSTTGWTSGTSSATIGSEVFDYYSATSNIMWTAMRGTSGVGYTSNLPYAHFIDQWVVPANGSGGPATLYKIVNRAFSFDDTNFDYKYLLDMKCQELYKVLAQAPEKLIVTSPQAANVLRYAQAGDAVSVTDNILNLSDEKYRIIKYKMTWSRGTSPDITLWLTSDSYKDSAVQKILGINPMKDYTDALHQDLAGMITNALEDGFLSAFDPTGINRGIFRFLKEKAIEFASGDEDDINSSSNAAIRRVGDDLYFQDPNTNSGTKVKLSDLYGGGGGAGYWSTNEVSGADFLYPTADGDGVELSSSAIVTYISCLSSTESMQDSATDKLLVDASDDIYLKSMSGRIWLESESSVNINIDTGSSGTKYLYVTTGATGAISLFTIKNDGLVTIYDATGVYSAGMSVDYNSFDIQLGTLDFRYKIAGGFTKMLYDYSEDEWVIDGLVTINDDLEVDDNISAGGAIDCASSADVGGDLDVGEVLDVSGDARIDDGLIVDNDTIIFGYLYAESASATIKAFEIDHPLYPKSKILRHASIEAPERMNIYRFEISTDTDGTELVLPTYFWALNKDISVQVTSKDVLTPVCYKYDVEAKKITVRSGEPSIVSVIVSGVRQDAHAIAHPLIVEEDKWEEGYIVPKDHGDKFERYHRTPEAKEKARLSKEKRVNKAKAREDRAKAREDKKAKKKEEELVDGEENIKT